MSSIATIRTSVPRLAEDRQKAIAELSRVTAEIEQAKKELAAIDEEARQAGVPPGWLR